MLWFSDSLSEEQKKSIHDRTNLFNKWKEDKRLDYEALEKYLLAPIPAPKTGISELEQFYCASFKTLTSFDLNFFNAEIKFVNVIFF